MAQGEDVLFRPVRAGFFGAPALLDGSVDLAFVMLCNEALDVEQENQRRQAKADREEKRPRSARR